MKTHFVLKVTGSLGAALLAWVPLAQSAQPAAATAAPQKSEYQLQMEREQQEHPVLKIGAALPDFALKGVDGKVHTPADYKDSAVLVVMFISNHCPASQNYESRMKQITADYAGKGVQVIAIAPNGPQAVAPRELNYSDVDDSFEAMVERATHRQFPFPYLYDGETQAIAHQFGPKVTPHVFIFDKDRKLRFEGRIDDAMREVNAKTHETRDALDALLAGKPVAVETTPVFGCSTKWNSAVAGKQRELKEWAAKPVAVETTTLAGLQQLMKNPTGKMLMINFWATWCGPCQVEYPELLTSYLWYRSRDFEFVSVSVDAPSDRAAVTRFLNEHHSAIRNLQVDTEDVYAVQKAVDPKWQSGVPYTIVLAPDGTVIYRRDGEVDILKLRRAILANLPDVGMFAGNQAYWRQ
ncbi:MAG: hypothetical protein RLZZ403_1201 [Pseudomonadota bacterium]|jgi:thiol-disulfide isomerase/thioredoxin